MKISLNWLKRYIEINISIEELVETFNQIGIEVESVEHFGLQSQSTLVVGEILEIEKHPNADKLSVCKVKTINDKIQQIVCGAKNFKLYDKVPVALPGTILPDDFKISTTTMRGIQSDGMMCSGKELGLGTDHAGLLILPHDTQLGKEITEVLGIKNDIIFDLSITANRGDYLSYIGISRALAAKLGINFTIPNTEATSNNLSKLSCSLVDKLDVDEAACSYYSLWSIKNVKVEKSPDWLIKDLESSGFRSINNVVDITNWVMLETGQPLHALDADKVSNNNINVRFANDGEQISNLDHVTRTLNNKIVVIADSQKPLAVAGIMGGLSAEITDKTVNILLESAYFEPNSTRKNSRLLNLSSDSSYRFARDVDPNMMIFAAHRAIKMLTEICNGESVGNGIILGKQPRQSVQINFDPNFLSSFCGYEVNLEEAKLIFERLGFTVTPTDNNWLVTIPTHRNDISRDVDLVEEYLQIHGTDDIETQYNAYSFSHREHDKITTFSKEIGDFLSNNGFNECYNYSLRNSEEIEKLSGFSKNELALIDNPLLKDQGYYRFSLIPGLLNSLCFNIKNGNSTTKFFEIGRIATVSRNKPCECLSMAFVISGEEIERHWHDAAQTDFYTTKSYVLTILQKLLSSKTINFNTITGNKMWQSGSSAEFGDISTIGIEATCGLIDLNISKLFDIKVPVCAGEVVINLDVFNRKKSTQKYQNFSQFPRSTKDVSIIVDKTTKAGDIKNELEKIASQTVLSPVFIEKIKLFDVFTGKNVADGKKSLGFAIDYRSNERTLTNIEIQSSFDKILTKLEEKYEIRKS